MNESKYIKLQSITYATKARNILLKYGIHSDIVKTNGSSVGNSCGYSLAVPYKGDTAVEILKSKGFKLSENEESGMF